MKHRSARLEDRIRAELSLLLQRELADPRLRLASVSRVEVSHDLGHARVGISVLGGEAEREAALAAFASARGLLRSRLAARLDLRAVPELAFELDRGAEHSQRISDLLDQLAHERDSTS